MTTTPFKVGDRLVINGEVSAEVAVASTNGRSLGVVFEAVVQIAGAGFYVGAMILLQLEDGRWCDPLTKAILTVTRPA